MTRNERVAIGLELRLRQSQLESMMRKYDASTDDREKADLALKMMGIGGEMDGIKVVCECLGYSIDFERLVAFVDCVDMVKS